MSLGRDLGANFVLGEQLRLTRGLSCYTLEFRVRWALQGVGAGIAHFADGHASVSLGNEYRFIGPVRLGPARDTRVNLNGQPQATGWLCVELDLSSAQLAALEQARGHGIMFAITLAAEGGRTDDNRVFAESCEMRRTFEHSAWVRCLNEAKYLDVVLLEVPSLAARSEKFREVDEAFRQSQEALVRGNHEDCVTWGRKTVERLETILADKDAVDRSMTKGNLAEWNKTERVQLLRRAAKILANPAAHGDKNAMEHVWSRDDATAFVLLQASILRLTGG